MRKIKCSKKTTRKQTDKQTKCSTGYAPEYLTSMFATRGSVSGRTTRNFQQLKISLFLKLQQDREPFIIEGYLSRKSSIQP